MILSEVSWKAQRMHANQVLKLKHVYEPFKAKIGPHTTTHVRRTGCPTIPKSVSIALKGPCRRSPISGALFA